MKVKLEDLTEQITDGKHGDCRNEYNSGFYFVSCKDINNGIVNLTNSRQIVEDDFLDVRKRIAAQPGDTLITNSGTIGRTALLPEEPWVEHLAFQKSVAVLKPRRELIDSTYFYYVIQNASQDLARASNGSAQKNLLLSTLREYQVDIVCEQSNQLRIASILSTYDALIENNRKQIKLLEEAAQRLYKEWFVDLHFPGHESTPIDSNTGLPKGWNAISLGEYVKFKRGKTITEKQTEPGDIPVVAGGLGPAYYHSVANAKAPVITISGSGANAGFTRLYTQDVWASDCSYVDSSFCPTPYFVFETVVVLGNGFKHLQRGSAQPHVYPKHINALNVVIPDKETLHEFECVSAKLFDKIAILNQLIEKTTEARNRLLPKLIEREIEVL